MKSPAITQKLLCCVLGCLLSLVLNGFGQISFDSLLLEMVNRDEAALWPQPYYTCRQASSHDRRSTVPGQTDWWANADRSWFIRTEENNGRSESVMMDVQGPGAIVRFWGTWHGQRGQPFSDGLLRIYLDGSPDPVIEAPISQVLSGGCLAGPPLSQSVSPLTVPEHRAHTLYLPIPYAEHCKITYQTDAQMESGATKGGEALYYLINYRSYAQGTPVRTFRMEDLGEHAETLAKTQRLLSRQSHSPEGRQNRLQGRLLPEDAISCTLSGSRAIRQLSFKIAAADREQALRSTVLAIEFDGTRRVWAPLGDFFGVGWQIHPYHGWFADVTPDGTMTCYWVMPFREQATVTLHNLGQQAVVIEAGQIVDTDWQWCPRSLYFHAAWRQWANIETRSNPLDPANGAFDLNWITIQGRGKYVGDVLTLYNRVNRWWGEGDEKIYVDGEHFPSHFGTGSEDYYGYAWCRPEVFCAPFHAQPCGAGNLEPGFTVNSRFRSLDAVPFRRDLRFDMELWHSGTTTLDYAPTLLWYGADDSRHNIEPMVQEVRRAVSPEGELYEADRFAVAAIDGGNVRMEAKADAGGRQRLVWENAGPGQTLVLEFMPDRPGDYGLYAGLSLAADHGIVHITINDQICREALDVFNPRSLSTEIYLGNCRIKEGVNRMEITIKGANRNAKGSHTFGLDYLKFISR